MPGVLAADEAGAETQTEHHTMRKNWQKIPLGTTVAYNGRQYIYDGLCSDWIITALLSAGATITAGTVQNGRIAVEVSSESRMGFACGDSYDAAMRGAVAAYLDCRPAKGFACALIDPETCKGSIGRRAFAEYIRDKKESIRYQQWLTDHGAKFDNHRGKFLAWITPESATKAPHT